MAPHALTVDELYKELAIARKNGDGKKKILLSNDDEGNGYHLMFYSVSPAKENITYKYELPCSVKMEELDNYVIIG